MKFYRYEYCPIIGNEFPGSWLYVFRLIKETPKGYWISGSFGSNKHWVSKTAKKRYAYPTKEEAAISFKRRSEAWVRLSEENLNRAKRALASANRINMEEL